MYDRTCRIWMLIVFLGNVWGENVLCLFQVVYRKQRQCCVTCGEQGSASLPCGHGLQCDSCSTSTECPLCSKQTLEQPLSWLHHPLGPKLIPPHQVRDSQIPAFYLNRYITVTSRSKWGLRLLLTKHWCGLVFLMIVWKLLSLSSGLIIFPVLWTTSTFY